MITKESWYSFLFILTAHKMEGLKLPLEIEVELERLTKEISG